jgi:hypothetical protein
MLLHTRVTPNHTSPTHYQNYTKYTYIQINRQGYVVRIIALVPLYSIQSWLSLRFHDFALFFGATKDCYEAYVIFSFFAFLQAVQVFSLVFVCRRVSSFFFLKFFIQVLYGNDTPYFELL